MSIPTEWPGRLAILALVAAATALIIWGSVLAALCFLISAVMGHTKAIEANRAAGKRTVNDRERLIVGSAFALLGCAFIYYKASGSTISLANSSSVALSSASEAEKALRTQVVPSALLPLNADQDPAGAKRLGERGWALSNDFRRWVALAALQSDRCFRVRTIAVWQTATRSNLSWNVRCQNGERFHIKEAQARSAKAQFDPKATLEERKRYAAIIEVARPLSAVFDKFDKADAEIACDDLMRRASVDRNSFQSSGQSEIERDEVAALAIIRRDYDSRNAMGGTISGRYECQIDPAGYRVVSLRTEDAFGRHVIY